MNLAKELFSILREAHDPKQMQRLLREAHEGVPHHPLSEIEVNLLGELDEANSNRPMTIPTANLQDIEEEWAKIKKPRSIGKAHEI